MCARFHSVERASPSYQNLSLAPVCPATPHLLHSLFHATFNPLDNLPSFPYLNSPPHLRNDSRACQHGLLPNLFQRTVWPFFDRCMNDILGGDSDHMLRQMSRNIKASSE